MRTKGQCVLLQSVLFKAIWIVPKDGSLTVTMVHTLSLLMPASHLEPHGLNFTHLNRSISCCQVNREEIKYFSALKLRHFKSSDVVDDFDPSICEAKANGSL